MRPRFTNEREAQTRFFAEWLGGDNRYSDRAYLPLKHRHDLLPITRAVAEQWLAHFGYALDSLVSDVEARRAIHDKVSMLALALVNAGREPSELRARVHGTCLRYKPAIESLSVASRGDAAALRRLVKSCARHTRLRATCRASPASCRARGANLSSSSFSMQGST